MPCPLQPRRAPSPKCPHRTASICAHLRSSVVPLTFPSTLTLIATQPRQNPSRCCRRESPPRTHIDGPLDSVYICHVPARKLQVGQVWKKEDTGESYLVTKVYNEALTTFAILRKAGAESERPVKVKVDRKGPAYALPGFSYAQESDEF
jgi:hypothetical protein